MKRATTVNTMNIHREYTPTCSPNAAPGLCTSVNRIQSPKTARGNPSNCRRLAAIAFVQKSIAVTSTSTGQNTPALLLRIFLALFAVDAVASMRERIEPLERNLVTALMTLPEVLGIAV